MLIFIALAIVQELFFYLNLKEMKEVKTVMGSGLCKVKIIKKVPYYSSFPTGETEVVHDFMAKRLELDEACIVLSGSTKGIPKDAASKHAARVKARRIADEAAQEKADDIVKKAEAKAKAERAAANDKAATAILKKQREVEAKERKEQEAAAKAAAKAKEDEDKTNQDNLAKLV